jgi:hypothetical protein
VTAPFFQLLSLAILASTETPITGEGPRALALGYYKERMKERTLGSYKERTKEREKKT